MPNAYQALLETAASRMDALETNAPSKARSALTCPSTLLGHLAWSRGLDHWSSSWSEPVKRGLILRAPAVARTRGTRAAIDAVAAVFGTQVDIDEWWQQAPEGARGTARASVLVDSPLGQSPGSQDELRALLAREGRASVHWNVRLEGAGSVQFVARAACRVNVLILTDGVQRGA